MALCFRYNASVQLILEMAVRERLVLVNGGAVETRRARTLLVAKAMLMEASNSAVVDR